MKPCRSNIVRVLCGRVLHKYGDLAECAAWVRFVGRRKGEPSAAFLQQVSCFDVEISVDQIGR